MGPLSHGKDVFPWFSPLGPMPLKIPKPDISNGILGPSYKVSAKSNHREGLQSALGPISHGKHIDSCFSPLGLIPLQLSTPDISNGILGPSYKVSANSNHREGLQTQTDPTFSSISHSNHVFPWFSPLGLIPLQLSTPDISNGILGPSYKVSANSNHRQEH